jgi:DNA-binding response OmpR family regulator
MPGTRLLLVDDDRLVLGTLARNLRDRGYRTETADSGEAALERAASGTFHLAVVDMRMPGLSGVETAQRLRAEHGIPALILSAFGEQELVQRAVAEGALGYVLKPVDAPQLVPAIEAALARARDLGALLETKSQLERALAGGRCTSMAIGILMERRRVTEAAAFEILRAGARGAQRKLEEHAADLVTALQRLNSH